MFQTLAEEPTVVEVVEGRLLEGRLLEGRLLEGRLLEGRLGEGRLVQSCKNLGSGVALLQGN